MYAHRRCVPNGAEVVAEKVVHGYCGVCGVRGTIYYVKGSVDSYETRRQGVTFTVVAGENSTDPEPLKYDEMDAELAQADAVLDEILEEIVNDETAEILSAEEVEEEEQEIEAGGETAISEGLGSEPALEAIEAEPDSPAPSIEMPPEPEPMPPVGIVQETPTEAESEAIVETGRPPLNTGILMAKSIDEELAEVEEQLQKESPDETAPAEVAEPTEDEAVAELPEPEAEAVSEPSEAEIAAARKKTDIARLEAELEALRN